MSSGGDSTRRLRESLAGLRSAVTGLAKSSVRWVYWKSGAARDDPHLQGAIKQGYWQGMKSNLEQSSWEARGRAKQSGEDLPS